MKKKKLLKLIPAVNDFLAADKAKQIINVFSRSKFLNSLRKELDQIRTEILKTDLEFKKYKKERLQIDNILQNVALKLEAESAKGLKKVINAGGVIIHTNLGRSLLSENALQKVIEVAGQYSNLEFDLKNGKRGYRYNKIKKLLKDLTGAEAAVVVNNNAAAVILILAAVVKNKEVVIARGEMVEIGGSFRIPEVMENSGAVLKEVGSTNKVYLKDYLNAISENTAAFIKVHTSNYRVKGFTHSVSAAEMVEAAHAEDLPVIEDLGSGVMFDLSKYGLPYEPTVQEGVAAGIDVLSFSGDKLLGGPQAGIIVGKKKYLDKIESHPLMRALRVDKMTLAALEETLKLYYNFDDALKKIPTLKMITEKAEKVKIRVEKLKEKINIDNNNKFKIRIIKTEAKVGGGAYPLSTFASYGLAFDFENRSVEDFVYKLRQLKTPVIARIKADQVIFDLKTVSAGNLDKLANSINYVLKEGF